MWNTSDICQKRLQKFESKQQRFDEWTDVWLYGWMSELIAASASASASASRTSTHTCYLCVCVCVSPWHACHMSNDSIHIGDKNFALWVQAGGENVGGQVNGTWAVNAILLARMTPMHNAGSGTAADLVLPLLTVPTIVVPDKKPPRFNITFIKRIWQTDKIKSLQQCITCITNLR